MPTGLSQDELGVASCPGGSHVPRPSRDVSCLARLDAIPIPKQKSDRPGYPTRMLYPDAQTRSVQTQFQPWSM